MPVVVYSAGKYARNLATKLQEKDRGLSVLVLHNPRPGDIVESHDPTPEQAGIEQVLASSAAVWLASPMDTDWFRELRQRGYTGKTILLHPGFSNAAELFPHAQHYFETYDEKLTDRIYEAIK
ncbi:hypothetical protein KY363_04375 [Candidatus Woesearchaeota archaeon]|nr:hypothetical protein [Candidatus Woesearchaeota archaeon]